MGNETCPPDPIGVGGTQEDLNVPAPVEPESPSSPGVVPPFEPGPMTQQHNLNQLHVLCQYGMSPSLTTSVIMVILSAHFANPALIMTDNLKQYVWTPDALTKIRIMQNTHFDPTQAGLSPAIVVTRGQQTSNRIAINDLLAQSLQDQRVGITSHVRMVDGATRIMCISTADGEAEDLALEVFDALTFLSPALRTMEPFHQFEVMGLGALGVLEDQGNLFGVPIDITYTYEYAWAVQPLAPLLKTFNLTVP